MPDFTVRHLEHSGDEIARHAPIDLRWKYQLGQDGPGGIQYSIADNVDEILRDEIAPYRTDWELDKDGQSIHGGIHTSVNFKLAGEGEEKINVVGQDWLLWLDQGLPAFDYTTDIDTVISSADSTELVLSFLDGSTVEDIVDAILDPLSQDPSEQIIMTRLKVGSVWDEGLVGDLHRSAGRTALSLLQEVAQMDSPYGFDFWADFEKNLNMVGPRLTTPGSVTPVAGFYVDSGFIFGDSFDESPIVDGDWTNNGPAGTDIIFTDGFNNTKRFFRKTDADSRAQYRRWVREVQIADSSGSFNIGSATDIEFKAQARAYRLLFPQKELRLTVKPELFTWDNVLMQAVDVDWIKPGGNYHRIDAFFWITSQEYYQAQDGSGDWLCDLTLDQIYIPIS